LRINLVAGVGIAMVTAAPAQADILAVVIAETGLPYSLSSSNYDNSPSNYSNSSSNYDNSASNYDNSASNYDNSLSAQRESAAVFTEEGQRIGYYVFSKKGVLNFYNVSGHRRVFYMPATGRTQSVFLSEGSAWCGTLGQINGKLTLGLTRNCMLQLLMD
jgi:hypothetical protein